MRVPVPVATVVPSTGVVVADPQDIGSVLRYHILNSFYLMPPKGKQVPAGHGVVLKNNELHKPAHQIILNALILRFAGQVNFFILILLQVKQLFTISFRVLTIYDVAGKTVRKMQLGHLTAGSYSQTEKEIYWDGQTETGEQVGSGTYFYQLQAGDYTEARKMVFLK